MGNWLLNGGTLVKMAPLAPGSRVPSGKAGSVELRFPKLKIRTVVADHLKIKMVHRSV